MNWEAVGAIGETAGAFGVIVTLLYLALQIRFNNRTLRSTKYQELIFEFRNTMLENSKQPQDIEILLKAADEGFESLTPVQYRRWAALMFSLVATFENAFHADRNGVADSHTSSFRKELLEIISSVKSKS